MSGPGWRRRPPPAAPARRFDFPAFSRHTLPGGLALYLAPQPGRGLLQLEIVTPAGAAHEGAAAGLATLAAGLLDEGTATADAQEIARRVERAGGSLSTGADWDGTYVAAGLLASEARRGLELVAEIVTGAALPAAELERLRGQRLAELQRRRAQPGYLAAVQLAAAIYGEGAVYGRALIGDAATLSRIRRRDVAAFVERHLTASGAALVAAGDFDPAWLRDAAAAGLAGWRSGEPRPGGTPSAAPREAITVDLVDRPSAPQTELRVGQALVPRAHPDFLPLQVLSAVLGGKFTSRLNLALREERGVTYGAYSRIAGRRGPGPLVVSAAVDNAAVGLAARRIVAELERLRDEPVGEEELGETISYLAGVFPYTVQTVAGVARRLEELALYGLPDAYWSSYGELLEAIDPAAVHRVARRYLRPEAVAVVAVGPADELEPQLAELGPLRRVAADQDTG